MIKKIFLCFIISVGFFISLVSYNCLLIKSEVCNLFGPTIDYKKCHIVLRKREAYFKELEFEGTKFDDLKIDFYSSPILFFVFRFLEKITLKIKEITIKNQQVILQNCNISSFQNFLEKNHRIKTILIKSKYKENQCDLILSKKKQKYLFGENDFLEIRNNNIYDSFLKGPISKIFYTDLVQSQSENNKGFIKDVCIDQIKNAETMKINQCWFEKTSLKPCAIINKKIFCHTKGLYNIEGAPIQESNIWSEGDMVICNNIFAKTSQVQYKGNCLRNLHRYLPFFIKPQETSNLKLEIIFNNKNKNIFQTLYTKYYGPGVIISVFPVVIELQNPQESKQTWSKIVVNNNQVKVRGIPKTKLFDREINSNLFDNKFIIDFACPINKKNKNKKSIEIGGHVWFPDPNTIELVFFGLGFFSNKKIIQKTNLVPSVSFKYQNQKWHIRGIIHNLDFNIHIDESMVIFDSYIKEKRNEKEIIYKITGQLDKTNPQIKIKSESGNFDMVNFIWLVHKIYCGASSNNSTLQLNISFKNCISKSIKHTKLKTQIFLTNDSKTFQNSSFDL